MSAAGMPLTYQNFLRIGTDWKPATLAGVPLVTGASFALVTSRLQSEGLRVLCEGNAEAVGLDGRPLKYDWDAEITAVGGDQADPVCDGAVIETSILRGAASLMTSTSGFRSVSVFS